jgi:hypothetical protein
MYGHEVTHARGEYDAVALGRDIGSGWRQSAQMLGDRQGTALIEGSVGCLCQDRDYYFWVGGLARQSLGEPKAFVER